MLKRKAVEKLPTLLQYLKAEGLKNELVKAPIEKIFWSDDWISVTFQTDVFRYSIKFGSDEEYQEAIGQLLDSYSPSEPMDGWIVYDGDGNGDVDVIWEQVDKPISGLQYTRFKQWDWGLTAEQFKFVEKPSPARKKKPSSKMTPDTPPAQLDPTL